MEHRQTIGYRGRIRTSFYVALVEVLVPVRQMAAETEVALTSYVRLCSTMRFHVIVYLLSVLEEGLGYLGA